MNFLNILFLFCSFRFAVGIDRFNEYDLAVLTAQRVQIEVLEQYNATTNKYEEFKLEVVEQDDSVQFDDQLSGYDEGVIVIKGEGDEAFDNSSYLDDGYEHIETKGSGVKKRVRKKKAKGERLEGDDDEVEVVEKKCKRVFKCHECKEEFEDKVQYREHVRSHEIGSKDVHVCDICGQTYKSKTALDIHVGLHKGVSPHKCEVSDSDQRFHFSIYFQFNSIVRFRCVARNLRRKVRWCDTCPSTLGNDRTRYAYPQSKMRCSTFAKLKFFVLISSVTNAANNSFIIRRFTCISWPMTISEKRNARSVDWSCVRIRI